MSQPAVLLVAPGAEARQRVEAGLRAEGVAVSCADTSAAALARLKRSPGCCATVLTAFAGPGVDGPGLLRKIKAHPLLKLLPVVMLGEDAASTAGMSALRAGAHACLAADVPVEMLRAVVDAALRDYRAYQEMRADLEHCQLSLGSMQTGYFLIQTLDEAQMLGRQLASAFPDADLVVVGLTELLVNAVEHGNLEIGYETKSRLLREGCWQDEIRRRQADPRFAGRVVEVTFQRLPGEIRVNIRDQGNGFPWGRFLEVAPDRVLDCHGRGIAIAREVSFDDVEYRAGGREVEVVNYYPEGDLTEF